jgi:hypothetical protein
MSSEQRKARRARQRATQRTQRNQQPARSEPAANRPQLDPRFASRDFARKLDRAETHIDALEQAVKRWLKTDAYTLIENFNAQTGEYVLKAKVTEPPGDDWPLLVGDAVHNLRSALDHIAYTFAMDGYQAQHSGGNIPANHQRRILFPIVAVSNDPKRTVDQFYEDGIKSQLRYVPAGAVAAIGALQPYKRSPADPTSDPLWIVHELDVIDKHRKLHTTAVASPLQGLQIGGGSVRIEDLKLTGGPVEGEREVIRLKFGPLSPAPVHMQRHIARFVALSEGPAVAMRTEVITLLWGLRDDIVTTVVPALTSFL